VSLRSPDGGPRARTTLRLERSPSEPRVLVSLAAVALLLVGAGWLAGLPLAGAPPSFDLELTTRATAAAGSRTSTLAILLGRVGHLVVVTVVAIGFALVARHRSGRWDVALLLATVLGGATVITATLKLALDRARPDGAAVDTLSAAYPSGHTVRAAAVFGLVAYIVRFWTRRAAIRVLTIPVAVALILVNGGARVVLGVHWPTDVAAGVVLGTAWLIACWSLLRPAPVPSASPTP
jgi:undecaprenyl-diphosphatase